MRQSSRGVVSAARLNPGVSNVDGRLRALTGRQRGVRVQLAKRDL
jgi:hypothetical protein